MAASAILLPLTIFFFFFHLPSRLDAAGFSVDLIHRDSPKSPLYNPLESISDRIVRTVRQSNSRVNYLITAATSSLNAISSKVIPSGGGYLMTISLGTPPVQILAVADTGSDLIWTQCRPCESCYKQDAPLFDPSKSSTYRDLSCSSNPCTNLSSSGCNRNNSCSYSYSYGDRSYTRGILATETLTMTSSGSGTVKLPKISFGCGHNNGGTFTSHGAGLVGLGGGPLSLISQLSSSIHGKFAYCLVPLDHTKASSRMEFGDNAIVSGNGVVSTPLISKPDLETFFFLTLEKITVGNKSVSFPTQSGKGNIIIDSGTTLTYLPTAVYQDLLTAIKVAINHQPTKDPTGTLELCYRLFDGLQVPKLKFGFDGAEVVLGSLNTFIQVDNNVACAAFLPSNSFAIFGNLAQQNFKVGYNLQNMKVAFQPTDCAHK